MKIAVVGLWHLGLVTTACLCKAGYTVIAYDPDNEVIEKLQNGSVPIFEPHLDTLLNEAISFGKLKYSNDSRDIHEADIVWIAFDTPVDDNDKADIDFLIQQCAILVPHVQQNTIILISSQIPVGTTKKLQGFFSSEKNIYFAYIPENLRLGKAIDVFMNPDRIVIGVDSAIESRADCKARLQSFLKPFSENLIWMSIASAEMTKHAINSFLALSVTFINEIAGLCEAVGANGYEVEQGLKSEARIGRKAYLHPGDSIAGGTLMRDVHFLTELGLQTQKNTNLISSIVHSNRVHQTWVRQKLLYLYGNLNEKNIAILGLTYKSDTNTLRRSSAIETCEWLFEHGCHITAFDPAIQNLPEEYAKFIQIQNCYQNAIKSADAIVIATAWPEFCELTAHELISNSNKTITILDPNGCIAKNMQHHSNIHYYSVGHSQCT